MATDLSDVPAELRHAVAVTLEAAGVADGHLAVELVGADRIGELNREQRGIDAPTDVLAFPVDGAGPTAGPRELGDVAICPEHCADLAEAAVHGVLHLCGYDHEADCGEMLRKQADVMRRLRGSPGMPGREAEDMPVDDSAQPSPGPGHDLTFPGPGEGRSDRAGSS